MASSAHNIHGGATSAPPPTPSAQPNNLFSTSDAAADALSRLLHRLPPALSLPTRRVASPPATCPPVISFSDQTDDTLHALLSSSSQLGFFQLTAHSVPSQLASSAESEALSVLDLPREQKESSFPKNWPLGYEGEEDEEGDGLGESLCLDSACSTESTELSLGSLSELTRDLESVGLRIVELLAGSVGFENPLGNDPGRFCTYMWISEDLAGKKAMNCSGGFYPYVVGLQYQIRSRKYSLFADSGWVSVLPQVDSVMVTIGDIAQVWSNGKLKKVRGRPVPCLEEGMSKNHSRSISMTVLITLPLDTRVSPLLPKDNTTHDNIACGPNVHSEDDQESCDEEDNVRVGDVEREKRLFNSFCFEDYAWRVYHERLLLKDPLDRYRIK